MDADARSGRFRPSGRPLRAAVETLEGDQIRLAHDLTNVLGVVMNGTTTLLNRMQEGDPLREHVHEIRDTVDSAIALIRAMQFRPGGSHLAAEPLDLRLLVVESERLLRTALGDRIRLETALPRSLWPVLGVRQQLERVLLNLALNARAAMPGDGVLMIELCNRCLTEDDPGRPPTVPGGCYVRLRVRDTGVGMTAKVSGRAFEPWVTTRATAGGNGLGLAIVRELVAGHSGHVRLTSRPGAGTTFDLLFPAVESAMQDSGSPRGRFRRHADTEP